MKQSDMNHLRRLLGWIRCDIGQAPAELQQTLIDVAAGLGHPEISEEAKARMVETYRRAEAVPLYVRAAVKALEKALANRGPEGGAAAPTAPAESRTVIDVALGAAGGPALPLSDFAVEEGLAEIGITAWGPRAEDWVAGAEYAIRLLRKYLPQAAAEPTQSRVDAAGTTVACRSLLAAPPALRRDDTGGACAARRGSLESASYAGIKKLAADLGNRDWKWWDSCSFRRLTFEDGPDRRDGSALHGTVQASDGHPDVSMAPGVREFIEAASPQSVASLCEAIAAKDRTLRALSGALSRLITECARADAQVDRELQRTFIYPNVLQSAKRVLAASGQEVQP